MKIAKGALSRVEVVRVVGGAVHEVEVEVEGEGENRERLVPTEYGLRKY